jgi:hypothetical protein
VAFESKKVYRALNGNEVKTIMSQRVLAAMLEDNAVNMARSFPLLRYEISIKLTPYQAAGSGEPKPEKDITYEVDGAVFIPVLEQAVELVENSPLYGREADPQALRELAQQGTVETTRTNTGELVDVRSKPGSKTEPAVEPPPVVIKEPQSWPDGQQPGAGESADETLKIEEARWAQRKPDEAVEKAVETRDPSYAPGRVSTIRSVAEGGGSDHGHGKKKR